MKKNLLTAWMLFLTLCVWASPVDRQKALDYAQLFLGSRLSQTVSLKSVETVGKHEISFYVINFYPQGWVIVSGDDTTIPVLGYSKEGSLDIKRLPDNMAYVLEGFEKEIKQVAEHTSAVHSDWSTPSKVLTRAGEAGVDPLIKVRWDQPSPFNKYCPMGKALVGCVAVAMSQAMSVQRYPDRPQGSVSYSSAEYGKLSINFDEQKAYNWDEIMNGSNNYDEVARLLMHAGMSVEMDYGEDGSGVPTNQLWRVSNALMNNFKYPKGVLHIRRDSYEGDWAQMLKNELNAGRAIVYCGVDSKRSAGHAWNIDGYDEKGSFHCNWGWGGRGNGFFSLNGLGTGNYYYDDTHIVITGIGAPTQTLRSISLSSSNIESGLPAGSVVGMIQVNGEDVPSNYSVSVHGTYSASSQGYKYVPFEYRDGLLVTKEQLREGTTWTVEITVSDGTSTLTQGFVVNVTGVMSLEEATSMTYDRTTQLFTVSTKNNVTYSLQNAQGSIVKSGSLSPLPQLDFYRNELSSGENKLTLKSATESITITIKK